MGAIALEQCSKKKKITKAISALAESILVGLVTNYAIAAICPTFSLKRAGAAMIGGLALGMVAVHADDSEKWQETLFSGGCTIFITGALLAVASVVKYFRP